MTKILLSLSFLVLMTYSCEPKKVSYEDATKWHSDCYPHPEHHPGDVYATESGGIYNHTEHRGIDETLCFEECDSSYKSIEACRFECMEKGHPIGDIAEHIEGGYYSDGSYFAMCNNPFENIHPTKDRYEKSKWQKDRDECMKLTSENVKHNYWKEAGMKEVGASYGFFNPWSKYYRECLHERGYSIRLY